MRSVRSRRPVPTLGAAIHRYLAEVSPTKKSCYAEHSIARAWLATRLQGRPIDRLRNTDLIAVRDEWAETKAAATVVRRLAFLSHVYTVARKDWGHTELANPAQLVRRPTVRDARDRRLYTEIRLRGVREATCPRDELGWIIDSTQSAELPVILTLATETAMRRAEICKMRREHVDLMHGVIHLPETKNGTARYVPMTPWARETLRVYLQGRSPRGPIFRITAGAATRAFVRACRRARHRYEMLCRQLGRRPNPAYFRDLRFHDLRHEATSRLASIFELHELAKITGHKDTRMLLRYYHPDGRELARKIARSPLGRQQAERIRVERLAA
ncbi:tyrosine-type recombinase/integrase [Burkholderia cenocepacia]|uniref:tyrosine-type recombinase/integrase n=1 Tax=Burkholderia cenocepacia TaxID=95486 RepID=UPI001AA1B654|nr:site-specific integrase [Burkholderia cenocepacia]MBO1856863.1 tyrosine-type recombinase/integrase [Burkholderia cenocepacia]